VSVLFADVEQFFHACHSLTLPVQKIDRENWFDLLTRVCLLSDIFDAFLWDVKSCSDSATTGLQKLNAGDLSQTI